MLATSSNSGAATPRPVAQTPGGAGAAATPATAPRGSDDGAGPLRIPFHVEKKGESTKAPGRADGTRGKGKGVVNVETAASALRSTQDNTVLLADVLRRLAVQGTVQPVGGKGTAQHWTAGLAVVVSGGLGMPDVHGRPAARDIKTASKCEHAHVRVVTASDVHFSRAQTIIRYMCGRATVGVICHESAAVHVRRGARTCIRSAFCKSPAHAHGEQYRGRRGRRVHSSHKCTRV